MQDVVGEKLVATPGAMGEATRRRPSIASTLHAELRRQIVETRLLPGQSLSENDIAAHFGLSRTPVREALAKLEDEGLILIYPQYGTVVAPIRIADVYDGQFVREAIECTALLVAVTRLEPKDRSLIETILETQRRHESGDPNPFFKADERLHAALLTIAGHERAWRVVEAAKGQHDRVRRLNVGSQLKRKAVLHEHANILDRLAAGDAAGAVEAMQLHLRGVFKSVEAVLAKHPEYFFENDGDIIRNFKRSTRAFAKC